MWPAILGEGHPDRHAIGQGQWPAAHACSSSAATAVVGDAATRRSGGQRRGWRRWFGLSVKMVSSCREGNAVHREGSSNPQRLFSNQAYTASGNPFRLKTVDLCGYCVFGQPRDQMCSICRLHVTNCGAGANSGRGNKMGWMSSGRGGAPRQ